MNKLILCLAITFIFSWSGHPESKTISKRTEIIGCWEKKYYNNRVKAMDLFQLCFNKNGKLSDLSMVDLMGQSIGDSWSYIDQSTIRIDKNICRISIDIINEMKLENCKHDGMWKKICSDINPDGIGCAHR